MKALVFCLALAIAGCGSTFAELEDAAKHGDDDAKLKLCRADARAAFYVDGKTEKEALAIFDACTARIK